MHATLNATSPAARPAPPRGESRKQPRGESRNQSRNQAVDAYRGLVMLLMMGEIMQFEKVSRAYPSSTFWHLLAYNQTHVEWAGLGLHDMIQPSFTFLVGVALPYSIASRNRRGESFPRQLLHTLWRSLLLVALGIFLRSLESPMTNFTFEDTLTQIGLGYPFAFLLASLPGTTSIPGSPAGPPNRTSIPPRLRIVSIATIMILVTYWLAWALYPAPGPAFNYQAVGVPPDWHHNFTGFASHWNKNSNLGQAFDLWFLNLFPRPGRFLFNPGGYLTLSFIPTLATMLLGLIAGEWFRNSSLDSTHNSSRNSPGNSLHNSTIPEPSAALGEARSTPAPSSIPLSIPSTPAVPIRQFLIAAATLTAAGLILHFTGINPIVKRIWTPAWTLFSGGLCFLFLAAFSWLIEVKNHRRWAFPLIVVGANSIAAYLLVHLCEDSIVNNLHIHLGHRPFLILGPGLEPFLFGLTVMAIYWLILYWLYRRKIFLRI